MLRAAPDCRGPWLRSEVFSIRKNTQAPPNRRAPGQPKPITGLLFASLSRLNSGVEGRYSGSFVIYLSLAPRMFAVAINVRRFFHGLAFDAAVLT